ncbi:MAG: magnesium transporter [Bacteroidetes bacterium]|nr:magnesium transporter [Bacteroidota bacterium]
MNEEHSYHQPVLNFARKDFTALNKNLTVDEALEKIRTEGVGERIVYFYAVDDEKKLVGVVPTRRLLTGKLEQKIEELMVKRVAALPSSASVYDACEFFVTYKFLAFPVVDTERKIVGIVDVNLFTEELLNVEEPEEVNDVFEEIGFRILDCCDFLPTKAWRYRFPWLLTTITGGTICALLAGMFEATLTESIAIAFFMALMLGLGESIGIQSMTVTIQTLHSAQPSLKWYLKNVLKEIQTASLIGLSSAALVGLIVFVWKGSLITAFVIALSVLVVQLIASVVGLSVPAALHGFKLDPKIAAGPITLALTDVFTILFYLGLATILM